MQILRLWVLMGLLSAFSLSLFGSGTTAIQNAEIENKHLFIFFYKDQNEKANQLQGIFDKTILKLGEQINSVKINVNDSTEKSVVERFNLKRSPMPFVVVLAPNGAITGGFHSFTEEQLISSLASIGAAKCLKALQDRKLVFLCLQNAQTANNEAALRGVGEFKADPRFSNATEIVVIDPSDDKELQFLNQLSLDTNSSQATTVLISPPAEVIGTYQGSLTKNQLVSDLQKATSGCCGPGGCCPGGKCGPR